MGLGKSFKKIAKAVVNPVGAAIEKATGLSQESQLLAGAGMGGIARMFSGPAAYGVAGGKIGPAPGPTSASGVNGFLRSMVSGIGHNIGSNLFGAGLDYWSADRQNREAEAAAARSMEFAHQERLEAQAYGSAEAAKAREYNTEMSNTSWQRGTADMKAAGLNPMLAFQQGGASTPTSASPSSSGAAGTSYTPVPKGQNVLHRIMENMSAALEMKKMVREMALIDQEIGVKSGERRIKSSEAVRAEQEAAARRRHGKLYGTSDVIVKTMMPIVNSALTAFGIGSFMKRFFSGSKNPTSYQAIKRDRSLDDMVK